MKEYRLDRHLVVEDWPLWLLILADFAAGLVLRPRLPALVAVHWGLGGQPNGWVSAARAVVVQPLWAVGVYLLFVLAPLIDPRRRNYAAFAPTLRIVRWLVILILIGAQGAVLAAAAGMPLGRGVVTRAVMAALLLVAGNSIGRVRSNWLIGIRTPWTLSSDEVWRDTHRLGGRCMVIGGLLAVPLVFVSAPWATATSVALLLAAVAVPVVYSFFRYRAVVPPRDR